ncbi:3-keto-disaccharide hydrolase [Flavivirga eckloniae]|uniref:3-keto-alpha-glucoside-1,2-lyase/3-keto-2-hydroxy-glucal hydratase domain-containing protein n=1 Tax=Flavivirga eckloniae TaxID=1803846 RepID=A0A2K9PNA1_9FLAO|nr:DUF1080 domain-containing protein [Flavivirga eckloniae]AUP78534.1 hypothetical protein C1H87_07345 [Flavivirga eckloniae]
MKNRLLTILLLVLPIISSAQGLKREYLKDQIHDDNRTRPLHVIPSGGNYMAPPSDAIILFDGTNTDAWEGNFTIIDSTHMAAAEGGLKSKQAFGDMQLHVEWRINDALKVNGQMGGNSGIFLMGLYEVQVLENFLNETYADGQAGAVYGQFPPLVNASAPQGNWNSYDIFFKAPIYKNGKVVKKAAVTVLFNGVIVQFNQEFEGPTKYKKVTSYPENHPKKAPLSLQYHGDPVEYRNIWVRDIAVTEEDTSKKKLEWINLFEEGKEGIDYVTTSRDKDPNAQQHFKVVDNRIEVLYDWVGEEAPFALISTKKTFSSFNMELEYKWGERKFAPRKEVKRDAGILFHVHNEVVVWPSSIECQIQEEDTGDLWVIKGPKVTVVEKNGNHKVIDTKVENYKSHRRYDLFEVEGWNHVRVEVRGSESARFYVNGHLVNEVLNMTDREGKKLKEGFISLQAEGAEIIYRNIRLQEVH